jgi:hypothetical protein
MSIDSFLLFLQELAKIRQISSIGNFEIVRTIGFDFDQINTFVDMLLKI